jgi:hypothetical protein
LNIVGKAHDARLHAQRETLLNGIANAKDKEKLFQDFLKGYKEAQQIATECKVEFNKVKSAVEAINQF